MARVVLSWGANLRRFSKGEFNHTWTCFFPLFAAVLNIFLNLKIDYAAFTRTVGTNGRSVVSLAMRVNFF